MPSPLVGRTAGSVWCWGWTVAGSGAGPNAAQPEPSMMPAHAVVGPQPVEL